MSGRIKVLGYSQAIKYTDGIEYRNFSPDLVGLQLASNGGTPLFTMGNFSITTNLDPKLNKTYISPKFSEFLTLSDLNVSESLNQQLLADNATVLLNLDKTNLNYYALFGSLTEYVRVSLEDIIMKWPASLYLSPVAQSSTGQLLNGYTFDDYTYDSLNDVSSFKVDTNFIINNFEINYLENGSIIDTFNSTNDLRNLTINYQSYVIYYNNIEYPVLDFTAATTNINDYIYLVVQGNPFSSFGTNGKISYHIKPEKILTDVFFNSLPDLEYYLLSRDITPIYTAAFKYPIKSDSGLIVYVTDTVTWPVSDGYNIDFSTTNYVDYATKLLDIANKNDLSNSNLMNRFLVSESITSFDTTPVFLSDLDKDTTGQKVNKTLQIYGRAFDEINNFISGIAFANVVTYNKQDNTPDIYLKNLARVLGWELVSSVLENNLLANYVSNKPSTYSGQSVGLTPVEADVELWRRLILNSPWLWKSKGTRKSIEFLLKFIGAPLGLVNFNEYIYKADKPIDVALFQEVLELNGLDTDITNYPIDSDGYPNPLADTQNMYFQNYGLWYRQTGGSGSTIDILTGNNPHVGPYDGGYKYINQFTNLIPNFSAVTITSQTITTTYDNLYTNYALGKFDDWVTTATTINTVDVLNDDGVDISKCIVFEQYVDIDPNKSLVYNNCGCEVTSSDNILNLTIKQKDIQTPDTSICGSDLADVPYDDTTDGLYVFSRYQYNQDGTVYSDASSNPILIQSNYTTKQCCSSIGGVPSYFEDIQFRPNGFTVVNSGYVCCDGTNRCGCTIACGWDVDTTPITQTINGQQQKFLNFIKPNNTNVMVTPDGCNCISNYTIAVPNIVDSFTGEIGYACQLTQLGETDLQSSSSSIKEFYQNRVSGKESCYK